MRFPLRKLLFSLPKVPLHLPVLLLNPALSLCMLLLGTELGKASLTATLIFVVSSEAVIPCCQPHGSLVSLLGLGLCTWKTGWSGCEDGFHLSSGLLSPAKTLSIDLQWPTTAPPMESHTHYSCTLYTGSRVRCISLSLSPPNIASRNHPGNCSFVPDPSSGSAVYGSGPGLVADASVNWAPVYRGKQYLGCSWLSILTRVTVSTLYCGIPSVQLPYLSYAYCSTCGCPYCPAVKSVPW